MNFEKDHIDYQDPAVNYEAVLYLRVSDPKQVSRGNGLQSQETRAREYAKFNDIPVVQVFRDEGLSGSMRDRPEAQAMLRFLRKAKPGTRYVVIIDEISRLARDYRVHFDLREAIEEAGALLDSPTTNFKAIRSADSDFVEGIQALGAQHFRQKNAETARNRKWARLKAGYWPYTAPLGYKYQMTKEHGNLLVPNEPFASILKEAFEGFASGRFATQAEVKRFFERQPEFPGKIAGGYVRAQRVTDLLTHPIYAGYVVCEVLGVPLTKGQHKPLISLSTFEKIQERRSSVAIAPARQDINEDFPLRNFVTCADCGDPLRSCWSKGKYKRYAYYLCQNKVCESYGKSIRRDKIESEFVDLLSQLQPSPALFKIAKMMVDDAWSQFTHQATAVHKSLKREITALEKQIDGLLDRLVDASSPAAVRAYERKIESLEKQKFLKAEKLENDVLPVGGSSSILELCLRFLSSPCIIWKNGDLTLKKMVLRMAFSDRLAYHRIEGYRTPQPSVPFGFFEKIDQNLQMVRPRGLEPPRVAPQRPQRCASTSSATAARRVEPAIYAAVPRL